jgi:sulfide:quinone oxidoreductase
MVSNASDGESRVVVAGGGIAGLESLLALRELGEGAIRLTLLAPEPEFVYRPLLVREPFGADPALRVDLAAACRELGVELVRDGLETVDAGERVARTSGGRELPYGDLVVCTGTAIRPPFSDLATTLFAGESEARIEELLSGGEGPSKVSFVVPPGVAWALPLYEVALLTARRLRERGEQGVELQLITPEPAPLAIFGAAAAEAVAGLLARSGIDFVSDTWVRERAGVLHATGRGADLDGRVIALPELEPRPIEGLPADERGFLPIDEHARVKGCEHVYAAGDGTSFPVKQGGLATQQADAAAEHIAAARGLIEHAEPFRPVLRGKLLTGGESLSMRAEIAGGGGEGTASEEYLWWPPHKVSGRYLAPWLAGESIHTEPEPPERPLEVEVSWPSEWHHEPMTLGMLPPAEPR